MFIMTFKHLNMQQAITLQYLSHFKFNNNFTTWSQLAAAFNSKPGRKVKINTKNNGLFNIPELQSSEGFYHLNEQCVQKTNNLISKVLSEKRNCKMVGVFDEISNELCKVGDLSEFIRIAHPSVHYKNAAQAACITVNGIVEKLNTYPQLYASLLDVVNEGDLIPTDQVDNNIARSFLFDFEQSGIHLPKAERIKVVNLNNQLLHLGQDFVAGCVKPKRVKRHSLPNSLKNIFATDGDDVIIDSVLAHTSDCKTRELAYRIYLDYDENQEYLLTEILKARYTLAQTCSFPTYADRALKDSAIERPDVVMRFLDYLSDGIKHRAVKDFYCLNEMKKQESPYDGPLAMWDIQYFSTKAKKSLLNVQNCEYSPYFSLGTCMEGLDKLFYHLYGINLVNEELMVGESWVEEIYKLAVIHESEGLLGYIYCDFYERTNKQYQDCHFTIQTGCMLNDKSYQLPIVVVMLNLPLPTWCSPTLLTPNEINNLFHEFGHAMHSMLARTRYQHVSGTRCSSDIAEVPSILMEYFSNDERVLRLFARHYQTQEPMPDNMLKQLCASKHILSASETQHQIFYCALDQIYHGEYPFSGSITQMLQEIHTKYYSLPYVSNTACQLRFSHLVGYGARYYSYLMSRAVASSIWQTYFKNNPLSRIQGEKFRRECLAHGGSKPPRQLIADYLQKEFTTDVLVDLFLEEIDKTQGQIREVQKRL